MCESACSRVSAEGESCRDLHVSPADAKKRKHLESVWRFMSRSCFHACEMSIWIRVIRCACQWRRVLSLPNMVKVGELCMWLEWDNLRRSFELGISIVPSIKQRRQLGDGGRARRCRSPLVYFLLYPALFVHFPPAPRPVPQHHLPHLHLS